MRGNALQRSRLVILAASQKRWPGEHGRTRQRAGCASPPRSPFAQLVKQDVWTVGVQTSTVMSSKPPRLDLRASSFKGIWDRGQEPALLSGCSATIEAGSVK